VVKVLAAVSIATLAALLGTAAVEGQSRDLWFGVVGYRPQYIDGVKIRSDIDPTTSLEPIAALSGGRWWFKSWRDDAVVDDAIADALGKEPARWLPPGTPLPAAWHLHLFDGRRTRLRLAGSLYVANALMSEPVVDTDFAMPRTMQRDGDHDPKGLAAGGDVQVALFGDLPASRHAELLRLLTPHMLEVERAEIQRWLKGSTGIPVATAADAQVNATLSRFATTPLTVGLARVARQRNELVYVIEGDKRLGPKDDPRFLLSGAAARSVDGALQVLGAWSRFPAGEFGGSTAIAVVQRDGASCWVIGHGIEGGTRYVLTRPGQVDPKEHTFSCDIK
jgi:hypothetical protein